MERAILPLTMETMVVLAEVEAAVRLDHLQEVQQPLGKEMMEGQDSKPPVVGVVQERRGKMVVLQLVEQVAMDQLHRSQVLLSPVQAVGVRRLWQTIFPFLEMAVQVVVEMVLNILDLALQELREAGQRTQVQVEAVGNTLHQIQMAVLAVLVL